MHKDDMASTQVYDLLTDQATGVAIFLNSNVTKSLGTESLQVKRNAEIAEVVKFSDTLNCNLQQMNFRFTAPN